MVKFISVNSFDNIYISSDFHYGHKNLCKGVSTWDYSPDAMLGCRDFETLKLFNDNLVDTINKTVGENDLLIQLGDVSFGGAKNAREFRDRLNVEVIFGTFGNHDHNLIEGKSSFNNIQDHTLYLQYKGQNMILNHYPMYVWHQSHKSAWCLHGHTHGSIHGQMNGKIMDVGYDSYLKYYGKYGVFSFEEIQGIMKNKEVFSPSHHNKTTS